MMSPRFAVRIWMYWVNTMRRWSGSGHFVRLSWLLVLVSVVLGVPRSASADVQGAYQREFAFLVEEKAALTRRLAQEDAQAEEKIAAAKAEIDRLQGQALALSTQAERMTELLSDIEREVDTASEDDDLVSGLLTQASTALENANLSLPEVKEGEEGADLEQLRFAFDKSTEILKRYSSVRTAPGEFFAADGQKVSGTLIHLGQVASYGVSDRAAGVLAPAGAGQFKLWPVPSDGVARALAQGEAPGTLKVFLYESLEQGIEKREDKTPVEVIESGGVIGWVIVAAGALALLMALIRAFLLWSAAANTNRLVERITPLLEKKEFEKAIALCQKARSAGGRVLVATLKNLHRSRDELDDIISEAVLHEQPALDRFGSSIIVVAAVAPLLGLLGTVTGMIATFDIITEFGTGNPKLLSGGIAIALVTTELGLIVAIPSLVLGNMLSGWAESIKDGMDKAALRVVNLSVGIRLSQRPERAPDLDAEPGEPVAAT